MKTPRRQSVFLERDLYRRRRVIDATKLLPIVGVALFVLPVLTIDETQAAHVSTSARLIYFFSVWGLLIAIAFVLSRWLRSDATSATSTGASRGKQAPPDPSD